MRYISEHQFHICVERRCADQFGFVRLSGVQYTSSAFRVTAAEHDRHMHSTSERFLNPDVHPPRSRCVSFTGLTLYRLSAFIISVKPVQRGVLWKSLHTFALLVQLHRNDIVFCRSCQKCTCCLL